MSHRASPPRLRIAFVHPDLGLGGAERLVVDAALSLQQAGHRVTMFTAHHDRARCFEATRDGRLEVRVRGKFVPMHLAQRLRAPCAIARMASLAMARDIRHGQFDIVFCDLVPHVIPLLRRTSRARIVFYCHFPDQLLTPERHLLYGWYRAPIDYLEGAALARADRLLVNSRFTAAVVRRTFPRLHAIAPEVLYPGIDTTPYQPSWAPPGEDERTIVSINRYERTKNLGLAVEAFARLRARLPAEVFARLRLVLAGGYDGRLHESRATLQVLQEHVRQLRLDRQIVFLRSCSDAERLQLLQRCVCVVYTPLNEHFGLVPLEAMAAGRPVVAANSGGPRETIRHRRTGLLCEATPEAFAEALAWLLTDRRAAERMGQAGREHVARHFSRTAFGRRLERMLYELV
jgi:alpha-1,3/alpha-1,6-mannosyltransferase